MRPNLRARMPSITGRHMLNSELRLVLITGVPLLRRHAVERRVAGDAGIVDQHLDRPEIGLDLLQARRRRRRRTNVPFVDRDAGLGLEFLRRLIVAAVIGGNLVAGRLQRLRDRRADTARAARHHRYACHTPPLSVTPGLEPGDPVVTCDKTIGSSSAVMLPSCAAYRSALDAQGDAHAAADAKRGQALLGVRASPSRAAASPSTRAPDAPIG